MVRANFGMCRLQMLLIIALLPTLAHTVNIIQRYNKHYSTKIQVLMISTASPLKEVQDFVRKTYPFRSVETDHRVLTGFSLRKSHSNGKSVRFSFHSTAPERGHAGLLCRCSDSTVLLHHTRETEGKAYNLEICRAIFLNLS